MKLAAYGDILIGEIDTTLAASATDVRAQVRKFWTPGCHEDFKLSVSESIYEHESHCTGIGLVDFRRPEKLTVKATLGFSDATAKNFRAFLRGADMAADVAPVTVTNQTLNAATGASAMVAGDRFWLGRSNIAAASFTGNAVALVSGTDYTLDLATGVGTVLQPITGPLVAASYSYQNPKGVSLFSQAQKNYVIVMNGKNIDGGVAGSACLYNTTLGLNGDFEISSTKNTIVTLDVGVLLDATKPASGVLGQIGFIRGFGLVEG